MTVFSNLKVYYYPVPARREFITLLLDDAGVEYEQVDIGFGKEWETKKAELIAEGFPAPTLPYITIDGKYMGKTAPIMRYVSKQLGKYLTDDDATNHYLDSLADICYDWYTQWVNAHYIPGASKEKEDAFHKGQGVLYRNAFENALAKSGGPYILGEKITYVDFIIYNCIVEDGSRDNLNNAEFSHLRKFADTVESRPSLQKHFAKH